MISFVVVGIPQPSGSKRAFPIKRKDGSVGVAVSEDAKGAKAWRQDVAAAAAGVYSGPPLEGPLFVFVEFRMPRPKGHFGKHGLRPSALPLWPAVRPDATKLLRAVEDACTAILWRDDAQIVRQHVVKVYASDSEPPGMTMQISRA